jgi:hypothetical protein
VSCDVPAAATFSAPGAKIDVTGTLFSLTAEGDTTTIRLYEGAMEVHSTADGGVQQLSAPPGVSCPPSAAQAVVSKSVPMQQTAYVFDPAEFAILGIVKLRVGLVSPAALEVITGAMSESKATVVTATDDQRQILLGQNLVGQIPVTTAAAVEEPPEGQLIQQGETVVGIGSFPALFESFCGIRSDVPDARLLYTPFTFASTTTTSTETTSTETGTNLTETGTETDMP